MRTWTLPFCSGCGRLGRRSIESLECSCGATTYSEAQVMERSHLSRARRERDEARAKAERLREALREISEHPLRELNPDGVDQAAWSMQLLAKDALTENPNGDKPMSRDTWTIYVCNECHQRSLDCDCKCGSDGDFPEANEVRVVSVQALHDWIEKQRFLYESEMNRASGCQQAEEWIAAHGRMLLLDALAARFPLTDTENQ